MDESQFKHVQSRDLRQAVGTLRQAGSG